MICQIVWKKKDWLAPLLLLTGGISNFLPLKTFDNSPCILYFEATSVYTASRAVLVPPLCTAYNTATYYRNNFRVYVCKKKLQKCFDWHHSQILTLSYFLDLLSFHKFTQNTQIFVCCLSKSFEKKWRETDINKIVIFVVMYDWHVNSFPFLVIKFWR